MKPNKNANIQHLIDSSPRDSSSLIVSDSVSSHFEETLPQEAQNMSKRTF